MSVFRCTTQLSWSLPLKANAGRHPALIMTIGDAAEFAEDEIRLGLADDSLWRQCVEKLLSAYGSPGSTVLLAAATGATQRALHLNGLLEEGLGGKVLAA